MLGADIIKRPSIIDINNNDVFRRNGYVNLSGGCFKIKKISQIIEYNNISHNLPDIIYFMIINVIHLEIPLFQLLKALPLFYELLPEMIKEMEINIIVLHSIAIVSLLLVANRQGDVELTFNNIINNYLESTKINFKRYSNNIYDMLNKAYSYLGGFILFESIVDYGSNGNVDYKGIQYYYNNYLMNRYSPNEYIALLEEDHVRHAAKMHEKGENIETLKKNINLNSISDDIITLLKSIKD